MVKIPEFGETIGGEATVDGERDIDIDEGETHLLNKKRNRIKN